MGNFSKDTMRGKMEFLDSILMNDISMNDILPIEHDNDNVINIDYYDGFLLDPLVYALYKHCTFEAFLKIVEMGADINNQCISTGTLPIHHAVLLGRLDVVKYLVERKTNINISDHIGKRMPLHNAVAKGFTDIVKFLCENGADVDESDLDGFTPLHMAAENGFLDIMEILLYYSKNVNIQNRHTGQTPLHIACENNNIEIIIKLLKKGAKTDIEDIYGTTVIKLARDHENFILSKVLENFKGIPSEHEADENNKAVG